MSALAAAGFLVAGLLAGALHFALLRWNAALYATHAGFGAAIGLHVLRLAATAALLLAVARFGAMPLLLLALGIVIARPFMVRRLGGIA